MSGSDRKATSGLVSIGRSNTSHVSKRQIARPGIGLLEYIREPNGSDIDLVLSPEEGFLVFFGIMHEQLTSWVVGSRKHSCALLALVNSVHGVHNCMW